ncbi:MAG TPA: MBL fold metallo-hydrolase, partial [Burkholderiales bacterium]|nr:MBL fold metallo-hydrolase [Burkholderiales bacterium]
MKDHVVLVESPLYDERALPVFEAVKKLVPGKPIRYVVNSHTHFDHAGGLRAAAAEGATIITQSQNKPYFEKAFIIPNRIAPDALAKSGKQPKIEGVGEKRVLTDGARTIEIHRLKNSVHTDTFLIVYLPREKLLIEADAYTPLPPDAQAPTPPNGNNVNLVENIEQLKLAVERILPLHGRMVPTAELYRTAGKGP